MPKDTNDNGAGNDQQQDEGGQQSGQQGGTGAGTAPLQYDAWLAQQPDDIKALIGGHIQGLRNTVQATRGERDALSQRLADLTKALGKDTPEEARRLLSEMQSELETTSRRAAFYEEAGKPEIGCSNPRAAFLVAQAEQLYDRRGNPDWAAIKQAAPELFRKGSPAPAGNAGAGTGNPPPAGKSMNDFIRTAAGRT
ncbi:MAG TPA: hypothetical protein PLJ35_19385 [Anaerolineae bacterium]|nr:hypothetical protein [Anaerolineae bacterium]HOR00984.1 hypothetical protein [Anaerolineae bacterium]HPL30039.1 hypothetical protein [Anaerolineae bacterium]